MDRAPRVAEDLNAALHALLEHQPRSYLLGEDIADPYGGAFGVARGLSSRFPDRVLSTPISEQGVMGVAGGLALSGDTAIVEIMFGDFVTLALDQLINFAAKSVAMYGRRRPVRLVVRCPVGGNRGYGPTHSQSPQKHLVGVPDLALYELSPFHPAGDLLAAALEPARPAVLFEQKTLYAERVYRDGRVDDEVRFEFLDPARNWVRAFPAAPGGEPLLVIAPGGVANRALDAAAELRRTRDVPVEVLVPGRLHPLDVDPVVELVASARGVCVAEESTEGGTWGADLARLLYERTWGRLTRPIRLVSSRDSVIPAAPHLERRTLLQSETIRDALLELVGPGNTELAGSPLRVPRLNANDTGYLLVDWLVSDGGTVAAGDPIAEVETSKALEEVVADRSGVLRHAAAAGTEVEVGTIIGHLTTDESTVEVFPAEPAARAELWPLGKGQRQVAAVVAEARRDIPDAFAVVAVVLDELAAAGPELAELVGGPVGLPELVVKAVAGQFEERPLCYGVLDGAAVRLATQVDVAVTVDAGNGLYTPVVRAVDRRPLGDVADDLMEYRMKALRGEFRSEELTGGTIAVSFNIEDDVVLVQPIIPPGLLCMVSVGGRRQELRLDPSGAVRPSETVNLGLAYDHRVVNGRLAVEFLRGLKANLEDRKALLSLAGC